MILVCLRVGAREGAGKVSALDEGGPCPYLLVRSLRICLSINPLGAGSR